MQYRATDNARTVLRTIHGSHLYGLAHEGSDTDTYEVVLFDRPGLKHYAHRDKKTDHLVLSFDRFLEMAGRGVPQALEALWSPYAEVDKAFAPVFSSLRPEYYETIDRHARTVRNFSHNSGGRTGAAATRVSNTKLMRHALRLLLNAEAFRTHGRFSPALNEDQIAWVKTTAERDDVLDLIDERVARLPRRRSA